LFKGASMNFMWNALNGVVPLALSLTVLYGCKLTNAKNEDQESSLTNKDLKAITHARDNPSLNLRSGALTAEPLEVVRLGPPGCTGTVMKTDPQSEKRCILTAHHCVVAKNQKIYVGLPDSDTAGYSGYMTDYGNAQTIASFDMAVVPVQSEDPSSIKPLLAAYTKDILATADVPMNDTSISAYGYGLTVKNGKDLMDGKKRRADVLAIGLGYISPDISDPDAPDSSVLQQYGGTFIRSIPSRSGNAAPIICSGDSGGPAFYNGKLIGVNSFVETPGTYAEDNVCVKSSVAYMGYVPLVQAVLKDKIDAACGGVCNGGDASLRFAHIHQRNFDSSSQVIYKIARSSPGFRPAKIVLIPANNEAIMQIQKLKFGDAIVPPGTSLSLSSTFYLPSDQQLVEVPHSSLNWSIFEPAKRESIFTGPVALEAGTDWLVVLTSFCGITSRDFDSVADLENFMVNSGDDGTFARVKDINFFYKYDGQSTDLPDETSGFPNYVPKVIKPTIVGTGRGRWILIDKPDLLYNDALHIGISKPVACLDPTTGQPDYLNCPEVYPAPVITYPAKNSIVTTNTITPVWSPVKNSNNLFAPAHKLWFAEIVTNSSGQITPVGPPLQSIVSTSGFNNDVRLTAYYDGLKHSKKYRFSVASCKDPACTIDLRWTSVDFMVQFQIPNSPVVVDPINTARTTADPVVFTFRSADDASHAVTSHFEIWAAVKRGGVYLNPPLTDVTYRSNDRWLPHFNSSTSDPYQTLKSWTASFTFKSGDQLVFSARACSDYDDSMAPRSCSLWTYKYINFTNPNQTLTAAISGTGTGSLSSSPSGIANCTETCTASFAYGTSVTITETPTGNSTFTGWSGACTGTSPTCTVTMDQARNVTANFLAGVSSYQLTVSKTGSGSGAITSSPAGISCGADCTEVVKAGTVVTLTATPASGSTFGGWSGACTGTGSCSVTMTQARSVTATFTLSSPTTYTLTASKSGVGSGTITSSPAGINCGASCSAGFSSGTSISLAATPNSGSSFAGWTGACTGTTSCTVSMTANKSVSAQFDTSPTNYTLTVTKIGSGFVSSTPAGISCGTTCTLTLPAGSSVTLTPGSGVFMGWSGACGGTTTCTIIMDASKTATATFAP
jgi:uncharacterized repeat protein (TIGR02543 family)